MSINVKEILNIWEWVTTRQGQDGEPLWYQTTWATYDPEDLLQISYLLTSHTEKEHIYCRSAFCVAGYITQDYQVSPLTGPIVVPIESTNYCSDLYDSSTVTLNNGSLIPGTVVTNHEGKEYTIQHNGDYIGTGAHILGLTHEEADRLFSANNSMDRIKSLFNEYLEAYDEPVRL